MREDPTSSTTLSDDPIDTAVRTVWLDGAAVETARLRASLNARLGTSGVPAITAPIPDLPTDRTASELRPGIASVRNRIRYTLIGTVLGAILLIATWRASAYRLTTAMAAHASIYTTANGERATITLPDGSTVVLNVASRLEVPGDFAAGNRALRLSGEAMFTVVPASGAPFTVRAGSSMARVLGTRFVVRHYSTDSVTSLAVQDGKVAVGSTVVTAAQQALVPRQGLPIVTAVPPSRFTFATSVLTLEGQRLIDAIPELNRWYDADIRLGDIDLDARRVGGQFVAGSLGDLTKILAMTLGVRVERNGQILTLYSR